MLQLIGGLNVSCVVNLTNHLMFPSGGEGRLFRETFLDAVTDFENSTSFVVWIFFLLLSFILITIECIGLNAILLGMSHV